MYQKNNFELRDVCGEKVLIAVGIENINFSKMIALNESAAFLWEAAGEGTFDASTLVDALLETYEVSREQAEKDVSTLLADWIETGIIKAV